MLFPSETCLSVVSLFYKAL